MFLRRLAPVARRYYSSTAAGEVKKFRVNAVLQQWLDSLPSLRVKEEDHVALSAVQSLVSTVEFKENGIAKDWKRG